MSARAQWIKATSKLVLVVAISASFLGPFQNYNYDTWFKQLAVRVHLERYLPVASILVAISGFIFLLVSLIELFPKDNSTTAVDPTKTGENVLQPAEVVKDSKPGARIIQAWNMPGHREALPDDLRRSDDRVYDASVLHAKALYDHYDSLKAGSGDHHLFSTDKSFLVGDYIGTIKRAHLMEWMIPASRITKATGKKYYRVMPITRRAFSDVECDLIKLTLHTMLSLGNTMHVPFTDNMSFLESQFGEGNSLLIKNLYTIGMMSVWEGGDRHSLHQSAGTPGWRTYDRLRNEWRETGRSAYLRYGGEAYATVSGSRSLKAMYGALLIVLQCGRCPVTKAPLDPENFEVRHILPPRFGGNNGLINLHATDRHATYKPLPAPCRLFDDAELVAIGLDPDWPYPDLTRRDIHRNPFGHSLIAA